MKVRIIYNTDKTISVIHPAPKSRKDTETESEWLNRVFNKATPIGIEYEDVESSELPKGRKDRAFWRGEKGKSIYIDETEKNRHITKTEDESKIANEIRNIAIDSLVAKGEIDGNL